MLSVRTASSVSCRTIAGQLELLGQVEGVDGDPEAVHQAGRRQHGALDFAVRAVHRQVQIALLVARRHARRRTRALRVDDHAGDLGHTRQAEHLGHQAEARAGRGRHRLLAGVRRAEHHADRRDLVFGLDDGAANLGQLVGQELHDVGGGGDRVASVAAAAGHQRAERHGVVARQHDAAFELGRPHLERAALGDVLVDEGVAQVDRLQVLVQDVGALAGQLRLAQQTMDVLDLEAEQAGDDADGDHVLGQRQLDLVLGDVGQRHGVRAVAVVFGQLHLGRVVDQDAARAQMLDRVVEGFLVEGQQHVDQRRRATRRRCSPSRIW